MFEAKPESGDTQEDSVGINKRYETQRDARTIPTVPWHPKMDATELEPGIWSMSTG